MVAVLALLPSRVETPITPPVAEAAKVACARPADGGRCLRALSTVAGRQAVPADGTVLYQRNRFTLSIAYIGANGRPTAHPEDAAYAVTTTVPEELWLAADGSGRYEYGADDPPRPASPPTSARGAPPARPTSRPSFRRPVRGAPSASSSGPASSIAT